MDASPSPPPPLSLSNLLCQESEPSSDDEVVAGDESLTGIDHFGSVSSDDEYVEMLFGRESPFGLAKNEPLVLVEWTKCARLDSITWILRTQAMFGFRSETVYLSMTYFDRFLSKTSVLVVDKSWLMRLLSVACLSLAAKMEELYVPALSEFEIDEYDFGSKVIHQMEITVLRTLDWRLASITPFTFIGYFIRKLHKEDSPSHPVTRIVELIMSIIREINLMQYQSSVIALAATLVALDHRLTRSALESKINSTSCSGFFEIEAVFSCYQLMKACKVEKNGASNKSKCTPTQLKSHDSLQNPSVNSSSNKRKRLPFND